MKQKKRRIVMFKEFKEFALKGNVVDLAVGIIIGGAFGKIVSSLVSDVLMPFVGLLVGGINISDLSINIGNAVIKYGSFLQTAVDFLIISFSIFLLVKGINKLRIKPVEEKVEPTTKVCPYCYSIIPIKATRCPNCTSELI